MKPELIVVCGPPGSGKSTYVQQHRAAGDLVWDFDEVMRAITGLPLHSNYPDNAKGFVLAMRQAFCAKALYSAGTVSRIWLIFTERCGHTSDLQEAGANIIELKESKETCLQRVSVRLGGARAVEEYFARRRAF